MIIKDENINYDYFLKQEQDIAREQGHGEIKEPKDFKEQKRKEIQNDQKHSLDYWINYLSSSDALYPDWLKYWAFRSMTQMGGYNKEKSSFSKRKKDSAQSFPTLNPRALAEVLSAMEKRYTGDTEDTDPELINY